jgi:hypothetical protein
MIAWLRLLFIKTSLSLVKTSYTCNINELARRSFTFTEARITGKIGRRVVFDELQRSLEKGTVICQQRVGGLHHRYDWAA